MASDSRASSSTDGAADCMRKASSYDCTIPSICASSSDRRRCERVQPLDQVELPPLHRRGELVVGEEGDRGVLHRDVGRADRRPLIDGRQERAGVVLHAAVGTRRGDRDEAGQVAVLGPQPVRDPRPERRSDEAGGPRVQPQGGLSVGAALGVHAVDDAQVVHVPGDVREQLGDPSTALAVLGEFPGGLAQQRGLLLARPAAGRGCSRRGPAGPSTSPAWACSRRYRPGWARRA